MKLNRATGKKPETIENNVLYLCENTYNIDGQYAFWITGETVKLGGNKLTEGYYTGNAKIDISVGKNSGICFDRYPFPLKETISPAPVADIQYQDMYLQNRLNDIYEKLQQREMSDNSEISYDDPDDVMENDPDLFVSDAFLIDIESTEPLSNLEQQTETQPDPVVSTTADPTADPSPDIPPDKEIVENIPTNS